jgi:hypothetical protein
MTAKVIRAVGPDAPNSMIARTSAGVQREIVAGMLLSADFVYTTGSHLATLVNLNQPLPDAAGNHALGPLPHPNFGFVQWREQNGKSAYKGIDLGLEKRFAIVHARRCEGQRDRTALDARLQRVPQNARDFGPWYGPSDYGIRHRLAENFVWDLPLGDNLFAPMKGFGKPGPIL